MLISTAAMITPSVINLVTAIFTGQIERDKLEIEFAKVTNMREAQVHDFELKKAILKLAQHGFDKQMKMLDKLFLEVISIMKAELTRLNDQIDVLYKERGTRYNDIDYKDEVIRMDSAKERLLISIERIYRETRETAFAINIPNSLASIKNLLPNYAI